MSNDESVTQPGISLFGCMGILGTVVLLVVFLAFAVRFVAKQDQAELERSQQTRRAKAVAEVRMGSAYVDISDGELLEMLLDDLTCRENVTSVWFTMADLGDPRFRRVREFPNLTELSFYDCDNADNVMVAAEEISGIKSLFFEVTRISNETLRSLARFPNLKSLHFEQVMADAKIDELKQLLPHVEIEACLESEEAEYR